MSESYVRIAMNCQIKGPSIGGRQKKKKKNSPARAAFRTYLTGRSSHLQLLDGVAERFRDSRDIAVLGIKPSVST